MENRQCRSCRYFNPDNLNERKGECRRYPPASPSPKSLLWALSEITFFVAGGKETLNGDEFDPEMPNADDNDRSLFASVYAEDWCGDFIRNEDEPTVA